MSEEEKSAPSNEAVEEETEEQSLPNQDKLDRLVQIIRENVSDDAIIEAALNEADGYLPTVVIEHSKWYETAVLLKQHSELKLEYLRNVTGVDKEDVLEVVYHLLSLSTKEDYCLKVRTEREAASVPSVTPIWDTANWQEREIYDLIGIDFSGHPDMRRIMMPDHWDGHPLRKDYVPLDPEV